MKYRLNMGRFFSKVNRSVLLLGTAVAILLFGDSLLYSVLPIYADELGIPLMAVGVLLSINRWIRLITNPLSARIFRRYGARLPLVMAAGLGVFVTFIYARGQGLFLFLTARILWGLSWSHLRLGGYLVVLGTSREALGLAMGTIHAIQRLGSTFTVLIGGSLVDSLGYRSGLTVIAFLTTAAIPIMITLTLRLKDRVGQKVPKQVQAGADDGVLKPSLSPGLCFVSAFLNAFIAGVVVSSLSLIVSQRIGDSGLIGGRLGIATITGALLAVRFSSNAVLSPLAGAISDMWGRDTTFVVSLLLQGFFLLAFALIPLPVVTLITACLIFFANNSLNTILNAAVAETASDRDTAGRMSVYATYLDLGSACGPLLGYMIGVYIDFSVVYLLGGTALFALLAARQFGYFSVPEEVQEGRPHGR